MISIRPCRSLLAAILVAFALTPRDGASLESSTMPNRDDSIDRSDHAIERRLTLRMCEIVDTPRSLAVALMLKHGEHNQLLDLEIDPMDYQEASHFADDYLATELLSKSSTLETGIDREAAAVTGFWEAESACKRWNDNAERFRRDNAALVFRVGTVIRRVLPPLFTSSGSYTRRGEWVMDSILRSVRHGPGASTSVSGTGSVPSDKYDAEVHLTQNLYPFARALMGNRWADLVHKTIVPGNRFTTVPKNAKKDRGICIEPGLNVFGQLGIGETMRYLLRRELGVDLNSQEWNQFLAKKANEWHLATIDLSAASDMIPYKAVEMLLPPDWFHLLDLFRSPETRVSDCWHWNEKFSSMGNGYTFELETLIFSAIVFSVVPPEEHELCGIYGDDIIVPQKYAAQVVEALELFGSRINGKKTYLAGRFFESCGTDWFDGKPVRPFYCRRLPEDKEIPYSLQLANNLRLYAQRRMNGLCCDRRFHSVWRTLTKDVPREWSNPIPPQLGDVGLIVDFTERGGDIPPTRGWIEGWYVPCAQLQPLNVRKRTMGRLLFELARIDHREEGFEALFTRGKEPRRGLFGKVMTKKVHVKTWTGSLAWC